jgi:DNA-binding PadR family transcriptional regulator
MKPTHSQDLKIRTIKSFADILILKYLKAHSLSSGYQILRYLHEEYNILFSPGTVYNEIYLLERKKLIKGAGDEKGRIYCLSDKGEKALISTAKTSKQIQELVSNILSEA